jgi:hypothetical protein
MGFGINLFLVASHSIQHRGVVPIKDAPDLRQGHAQIIAGLVLNFMTNNHDVPFGAG